MHHETLIQTLSEELQRRHGCHAVILYGSRARGDETSDSDYDLAGFRSARRSAQRRLSSPQLDLAKQSLILCEPFPEHVPLF